MVGRCVTPVMVLCSLAGAPVTWAQQELPANPGFEEVGDNGLPTGWSRYGGGVPESVVEVPPPLHQDLRLLQPCRRISGVRRGPRELPKPPPSGSEFTACLPTLDGFVKRRADADRIGDK